MIDEYISHEWVFAVAKLRTILDGIATPQPILLEIEHSPGNIIVEKLLNYSKHSLWFLGNTETKHDLFYPTDLRTGLSA